VALAFSSALDAASFWRS